MNLNIEFHFHGEKMSSFPSDEEIESMLAGARDEDFEAPDKDDTEEDDELSFDLDFDEAEDESPFMGCENWWLDKEEPKECIVSSPAGSGKVFIHGSFYCKDKEAGEFLSRQYVKGVIDRSNFVSFEQVSERFKFESSVMYYSFEFKKI